MSEPKAPYNLPEPDEETLRLNNLRMWLVTTASEIGSRPDGGELKRLFDSAYCDARLKYYEGKYPMSNLDIEIEIVKNLRKMEERLNGQ